MDQPLYLLFGAGAIIVISALFLRKRNNTSDEKNPAIHTSFDRKEIEGTLKRFVAQVQKENDQAVTTMERNHQKTASEIHQLNERVQHLENELKHMRSLIHSRQEVATTEETIAEPEADSLFLKERFKRVFELKREGLSADEIAKRLGAGRGEIDLIFSLATPEQRGSIHDKA
ncbi:DUF6115 domain-containing protein [Brevibacillus ginsengisoli]|uniref:DUF6115 domain-containing protein n=1 Tax=Brevibacillus ginsengisoli TaxID=363854 RepID=UPI003CFB0D3C